MLGIEDPLAAYCFDSALALLGNTIRNALESVEGKNRKQIEAKQALILARYLSAGERKFRDPGG